MHRADEAGYPEIRVGKINPSPFSMADSPYEQRLQMTESQVASRKGKGCE